MSHKRVLALLSAVLPALSIAIGATAIPRAAAAGPIVERPIVIGHRGASGYLPEETMAGYHLAVQMGVDFIEPDLFMTTDGVLVARHDRYLNTTTNILTVAATDPELMAKRSPDGRWYIDMLTYADIQKLSAKSRGTSGYAVPPNDYYTGAETFPLATFREVLDYAYEVYRTTGKVIGVYPEVKTISGPDAPAYHVAVANAMVAMLGDPKYRDFFDGHLNNVFLQSFDGTIIQYLDTITGLPLIFLTGCPSTAEAAQLIASYADGVGISAGSSASNAACVERAHAAGLQVHVYTLYNVPGTYETVYGWGVDGIFGNFPDVNKAVRDATYPLATAGFHAPLGPLDSVSTTATEEPPVADESTRWNVVAGGRTVPFKFEVLDVVSGASLTTLMAAVDRARAYYIPGCAGEAGEEVPYPMFATGGKAPRYDAEGGQFVFTGALPNAAGECYRVTITTRSGSAIHAFFRTR